MHPTPSRIAIVTGANTGIGLVTARELARSGFHVFLACRDPEKTRVAQALIHLQVPQARTEFLELDLADFHSIRRAAQTFLARDLPLHLLVNNAGLGGGQGTTASGFELAFGVNHMGHFLLTKLLEDRLKDSAPSRVVTVASRAHTRIGGLDFSSMRRAGASRLGVKEYCASKLANVLFSAELGRRLNGTGVSTYALHPGVVASDIWRKVPAPFRWLMKLRMIDTEQGARTTLFCATAEQLRKDSGLYYDKCRAVTTSHAGADLQLAAALWQYSEAGIGQ
jgi:retinol dehydrogenase 12